MSQAINAGLLQHISGFDPGTVHVGFVVDEVALGHLSLPVIRFSLSVSFQQCSILILSQYCSCMKDKRVQPGNLTKPTCNSGQTSSFSSELSVIKQGETACGSTCNKTALCNLYTCSCAFTDICMEGTGAGRGGFICTKLPIYRNTAASACKLLHCCSWRQQRELYHVRYICNTSACMNDRRRNAATGQTAQCLTDKLTDPLTHKFNDPQRTQLIDNTDNKLTDWSAARPTASSKLNPSYIKSLISVLPFDSLTMKDKRKWPPCSNTQYVLTSGGRHVSCIMKHLNKK
jgi:hypothetical protein